MSLQPFALERYFAQHEFSAPYNLCSSDCQTMTIQDLLAFEPNLTEQLLSLSLGYTESKGSLVLRQAIANLYETVHPDQVIVHTGAQEAVFSFMNAYCQPGDHVIVQAPGYQSLSEVAQSVGAQVSYWLPDKEHPWSWALQDLEGLLTPKTKLVVVNMPHNPTGYVMPHQEYQALLALLRSHGIALFSDEVYRFTEYNLAHRLPAAVDSYELGFTIGSTSKALGLPGLRMGWTITKKPTLLNRIWEIKDYTTICPSQPSMFLSEVALRHAPQIIEKNVKRLQQNLVILNSFFERYLDWFVWKPPIAGPIGFPRLLFTEQSQAFCDKLVEQAGIFLLPANQYFYGNGHVRIGFGRANFPELLDRFEAYLQSDIFPYHQPESKKLASGLVTEMVSLTG